MRTGAGLIAVKLNAMFAAQVASFGHLIVLWGTLAMKVPVTVNYPGLDRENDNAVNMMMLKSLPLRAEC